MSAPIDIERLRRDLAAHEEIWTEEQIDHGFRFLPAPTILEMRALLAVFTAACAEVDRAGPLLAHERRRDPLCVAVDAARGLTAEEAVAAASRDAS